MYVAVSINYPTAPPHPHPDPPHTPSSLPTKVAAGVGTEKKQIIIYLFIDLLKAYSPRQPHRVTSGLLEEDNSNIAACVRRRRRFSDSHFIIATIKEKRTKLMILSLNFDFFFLRTKNKRIDK